jgi:hypothetical protein
MKKNKKLTENESEKLLWFDWDWLTKATFLLMIFTSISCILTAGLFLITRNNYLTGQRAYVGITNDNNLTIENDIVTNKFAIKNHGITPANNVNSIVFSYGSIENKRIYTPPYPPCPNIEDLKKSNLILPPKGSGSTFTIFPNQQVNQSITIPKDAYLKALNGDMIIYFYGNITYYDVFNIKHTTNFFQRMVGSNSILFCDKHNNSD